MGKDRQCVRLVGARTAQVDHEWGNEIIGEISCARTAGPFLFPQWVRSGSRLKQPQLLDISACTVAEGG